MIDLKQYEVKPKEGSPWGENITIDEIKDIYNAPFRVDKSPTKEGKCFFSCGALRGYVSDKLVPKLKNESYGTLIVSEYDSAKDPNHTGKPFKGLILHEQKDFGPAVAAW